MKLAIHLPLFLVTLSGLAAADDQTSEAGYETIFDGESLAGWRAADMSYWSVEGGAITAKITDEHPSQRNHYLVWQGGKLGDFDLKLRFRMNSAHEINGGFQFRSEIFDGEIPNDCRGYQVDTNTNTPWLVRLYDEFGRETLAMRGERATFNAEGNRTASTIDNAAPDFRLEDWHEYRLHCVGAKIELFVDGKLAAEVVDNDPKQRDLEGVLALQLHSGPPMTVQFRDIRIKRLN